MGTERARAALASAMLGATGVTWIPSELLTARRHSAGLNSSAQSLQAIASELRVDMAFVPASEPWAREAVELLRGADIASAWVVSGMLGVVAQRRGWSRTLRDTAASPGDLAYAIDEALHEALEQTRSGLAAGADALVIADDLAGADGWLVAPDFVLEVLMPCYRHVIAEWGSPASLSVFHSDGDIRAIMPQLARAGFSAIHFGSMSQHHAGAAVAAARMAGLCPCGGVDTSGVIDSAAPSPLLPGLISADEGYIVCDDGGICTAEQLAAYATVMASVREIVDGESV